MGSANLCTFIASVVSLFATYSCIGQDEHPDTADVYLKFERKSKEGLVSDEKGMPAEGVFVFAWSPERNKPLKGFLMAEGRMGPVKDDVTYKFSPGQGQVSPKYSIMRVGGKLDCMYTNERPIYTDLYAWLDFSLSMGTDNVCLLKKKLPCVFSVEDKFDMDAKAYSLCIEHDLAALTDENGVLALRGVPLEIPIKMRIQCPESYAMNRNTKFECSELEIDDKGFFELHLTEPEDFHASITIKDMGPRSSN